MEREPESMGIRYPDYEGSVVASSSKFELFKKTSCFHDSEMKMAKMPGMQFVMGRQ
jgi:hypothetical protein